MRFRRRPRAYWVHPHTHTISKFFPRNPPVKGDVVLVDGVRCRVVKCPVEWESLTWTMSDPRGVKVRRDEPVEGACPTCGAFTMRGSRGVHEEFRVCSDLYHGPPPEQYVKTGRTFGPEVGQL